MKNIVKRIISAAICTVMISSVVCFASACKEETPSPPAISVFLTENNLTLDIYATSSLSATATDGNTVQWSVSDPSVVSIEANGNECTLNALKDGTADVTAACGSAKAVCAVTVIDNGLYPNFTLDNLAEGQGTDYELNIVNGESFDILSTFSIGGEAREDYTVKYSTENKSVISVSEHGAIKGLKEGTEILTATASWNGNTYPSTTKTAEVTVTDGFLALSSYKADILYDPFVKDGGSEKNFKLNTIKAKAYIGGEVKEDVNLSFKIEQGAALVTTSNNVITSNGSGAGMVRIAVSAEVEGKELTAAYFSLNVAIARGIVTAANNSVNFMIGSMKKTDGSAYTPQEQEYSLGAITVKDYNGGIVTTPSGVTYTSSNTSLVTVNQDGEVSLVNGATEGICTISVFCLGQNYDVCTVTVSDFDGYTVIETFDDLKAMEQNGNYVMVSDVDLNGHSGKIIDSFGGILDGNGHAIKNGVLPVTNADTGTFIKTLTGTLKNVAFTGFTVNGTKTNWGYKGIIGTVKPTAVIENVFIGMQVEAQAGTDVWCTGVVAGKVENGATVRNIVADVTYTDEFTNWHTLFGDIDRSRSVMQNCYAIAGEYSNKITDSANGGVYTNNFETVEALKAAYPELFAENGAFATEFWADLLN